MGRIFLLVAVLVLAIRVVVLWRVNPSVNSDEAIVGLMAMQVVQGGPVPVFFYGNAYLGSLEALLAVGSFLLLGPSAFALRLAPLGLWAVYLALLYVLARRILGPRGALVALLLAALPPSFVAVHVELAVGSYSGTLATGLAVLLLADVLAYSGQRRPWVEAAVVGGLGLAGGLALWTHPQTAPYLAAAGALLLARRRDLLGEPRALLAFPGLGIALAPAVAWNAANDWRTVTFLLEGRKDSLGPAGVEATLRGLATFALPEALGIRPFLGGQLVTSAPAGLANWAFPILAGAALAWLVVAQLGRADDPAGGRLSPALAVVGVNLVLLVVTRFGGAEPPARYLAATSSVLPLVVSWLLVRLPLRVALPLLLAVLVAGANQSLSAHPQRNEEIRELAWRLDSLGISRVYAGYWTAYALAFESRGAIVASPRFGPAATERIPEFTSAVDQAPPAEVAFVFPSESEEDRTFASHLAVSSVQHTRESLARRWHLYHGFSEDPRPAAVCGLVGQGADRRRRVCPRRRD